MYFISVYSQCITVPLQYILNEEWLLTYLFR
uniref:Uncharacterized protein n=1 Tax=Anguilla anguilla TaxID=7936 RepID=A0A0E9XH67_ANGAN